MAASSVSTRVINRQPAPRQFAAASLQTVAVLTPVSVTGKGYAIDVVWTAVPGANDVAVDSATLLIGPYVVRDETPVEWGIVADGPSFDVNVPSGTRAYKLTLEGFAPAPPLLAIAVDTGNGFGPPLYTVPEVPGNGVIPASFTGATLDNSVLTLPDVAAKRLRLSAVPGFPANPSIIAFALSSVQGFGATLPRDLKLVDETNAVIWAFPGEMPPGTPPLTVDLRFAIEKILKPKAKSQKAGQPLTATFTLTGTAGQAAVSFSDAKGAIVRRVPAVITTELAGEPVALLIPGAPLAAEKPSRATAGVDVKYHGIRLLESLADAVPAQAGAVGGVVVADAAVVRTLPPAALDGMRVAKIGLIGRAPVECELVVQFVDMSSGAPGKPVTQPATAKPAPSNALSVVWLNVPKHDALSVPIGVSVRTNHGRFLWASDPNPLLRVAVLDDNPDHDLVRIGGSDAVSVDAAEVHKTMGIDSPAFASAPPLIESFLFATVDLSDLTLEYDR